MNPVIRSDGSPKFAMVSTLAGAVGGYCVGTLGPAALALTLSGASGAMLYIVFGELLPEAARRQNSALPARAAVVGLLTGLAVVSAA